MTSYNKIGQVIGIFVASVAIPYAYDYASKLKLRQEFVIIGLFLVFLIGIKILESLVVFLIDRSTLLQRALQGKNYIDGIWFDKTWRGANHTYGVVSIETVQDEYVVVGREYDENCRLICDWQSRGCSFDGTRLDYLYIARWAETERLEESFGYTSLTMLRTSNNRAPRTYTGYFVDTYGGITKVEVHGEKITKREAKSLCNIAGIEAKLRGWIENAVHQEN